MTDSSGASIAPAPYMPLLATTGPTVFSLRSTRSDAGLLRGRLLRVGGFRSEPDAFRAGERGIRLLAAWLALRKRVPIEDPLQRRTGVGSDRARRWTDPGGQTIARVVGPGADAIDDDWEGCLTGSGYGVEFILPEGLFAAVALHLANLVYEAMTGPRNADAADVVATSSVLP